MPKSLAFKLAEISRHIYYDTANDDIVVSKELVSSRRKSGSVTTTATTLTTLDSYAIASYTTARYIVSIVQGSNYHSTEIVISHNGTTADILEYGTLTSGSELATFTADINNNNARLLITPASSTSTVFKFDRQLVEA
jgi:hypothetical protein|tara:strand:+ start:454 stop:867 length:414 start_codon:yes stop_codon:yes gene_type:complete